MELQESFKEIVDNFKKDIDIFLKTNGLDKYSVLVHFEYDRPTGVITTLKEEPIKDIAFFDDVNFVLYQDCLKSA